MEIAAFTRGIANEIDENLFAFNVWQKHPCDYEAAECQDDELVGTLGACSEAKKEEIRDFQSRVVSKEQAD